jgi:type I restriction enzyme S subunit
MSPLYTVFKLKDNAINATFAEYYFLSAEWYKYMKSVANYGARHDRMAISNDDFFSMPIPLPPLAEQRAIAEVLTTSDRLIAVKARLIAAKQEQKRWLMQNLLTGKMRLPGFGGKWENVKLGEYLVEYTGKTTESNQFPVLTSSRRGLFLQSDYYNKEIASEDNTGYNIVPYGYFTFCHMSDDEVFRFNINTLVPNGIVSTLYPVFATKDINDKFLLEILNNGIEFNRFVRTQKQGGSRTYVYFSKLQELIITLPPLPEQTAIAEILATADREIELLNRELEQQWQVKKYLMQQLLTGRIRVGGAAV